LIILYIEQPKKPKKPKKPKNEKKLPEKTATVTAVNDFLYDVFIFSK